VRSIFTLAHKLQPCVVFFDEVRHLPSTRGPAVCAGLIKKRN
jgi:SpoVK/Ycf46/Vps4 family AAA+-type ATPase